MYLGNLLRGMTAWVTASHKMNTPRCLENITPSFWLRVPGCWQFKIEAMHFCKRTFVASLEADPFVSLFRNDYRSAPRGGRLELEAPELGKYNLTETVCSFQQTYWSSSTLKKIPEHSCCGPFPGTEILLKYFSQFGRHT